MESEKKQNSQDTMFSRVTDEKTGKSHRTRQLRRKPSESDDDFKTRMTKVGYIRPDTPEGHWGPDQDWYHFGDKANCRKCKPGGKPRQRNTKRKGRGGGFVTAPVLRLGKPVVNAKGIRINFYFSPEHEKLKDVDPKRLRVTYPRPDDGVVPTDESRHQTKEGKDETSKVEEEPKIEPKETQVEPESSDKSETEQKEPSYPKDILGLMKKYDVKPDKSDALEDLADHMSIMKASKQDWKLYKKFKT
jgi:hypothetical protein